MFTKYGGVVKGKKVMATEAKRKLVQSTRIVKLSCLEIDQINMKLVFADGFLM